MLMSDIKMGLGSSDNDELLKDAMGGESNERTQAIIKLYSELLKGEKSGKEQGRISLYDVESSLEIKMIRVILHSKISRINLSC